MAEHHAHGDRPHKNADVIALADGVYRIVDGLQQQVAEHFHNAARRRNCLIRHGQRNGRRPEEACAYGNERGSKSAEKIKHDNRLDVAVACNLLIGNRRHHEHEDEDRRHALQCCDKEAAEETDALGDFREGKAERYA